KSFGSIKAVKNISFHIPKGISCAFLGTNGAGKSTMIHLITGLMKADHGKITLEEEATIGVVFQQHRLDDALTIEENLIIRAKLSGLNRDVSTKRMNELLKLANLTNKKKRNYNICSVEE